MKRLVSDLYSLLPLETAAFRQRANAVFNAEPPTQTISEPLIEALIVLKEQLKTQQSAPSREELELAIAAIVLMHLPKQQRAEGVLHG